jgi:hypothetical protein
MVREGKCKVCGAPAVTKFHCEKHRLAVNTRAREALHKRDRAKRRYAGAEYASGDHAATVFHFPKWLLAEPFVLQYSPETGNFSCMLLDSENKVIGIGKSVTQAAKRSLRATRNQPKPLAPFPTGLHTRTRANRSQQRFRYGLHAREEADRKRIASLSRHRRLKPPLRQTVRQRRRRGVSL